MTVVRLTALTTGLLILFALFQPPVSLAGKGGGKGGGGGGNDGGSGGESTPPPVEYEVELLGTLGGSYSQPYDINNSGTVVGSSYDAQQKFRAFVVRPANADGIPDYWRDSDQDGINDLMIAVDEMFELDQSGQPTTTPTVPAGWRANFSWSINDFDYATVTLYDEVNQVRLLTKLNVVTQTIEIIDETTGARPHAFVNDYGDVVYTKLVAGTNQVHLHVSGIGATNLGIVVEDLTGFNNAGQFVGMVLNGDRTQSIRYTLGVGLETFSEAKWTYAINDAGDFTGAALARKGKKYKAFLYSDTAGFDYIGDGTAGDTGYGININGDVCGWLEWSAFLDTAEDGLLKVDDLVVGTSAELAIWSSAARTKADAMNDRDSTGFPQLCGTIDHSIQVGATTGEAFVLTPIPTN